MTSDLTQDALDLLEDFLCDPMLSDREQHPLRQLAALQMQAHVQGQPNLSVTERKVIGLLISRWLHALTDKDLGLNFTTDALEITTSSLAGVLGLTAADVGLSLEQLTGSGFITVVTAEATLEISLAPLLSRIAIDLAPLLYRDLMDRHGIGLRDTAAFYLDSIAQDMAKHAERRPSDPRLVVLRSDYDALKARTTPDELLALWPVKPKAMYAWLEDLAAIEERLAILSKYPDTALGSDLGLRASEKILILSGRLDPHAA